MDEGDLQSIVLRAGTAGTDEIYASIAGALPPEARQDVVTAAGLRLPTPRDIGKAFVDNVMPSIKDGICGKAMFCDNRDQYDTIMSLTALVAEHTAEAIGQVHGAVGAGSAARLTAQTSAAILKEGLNTLCGCPEV